MKIAFLSRYQNKIERGAENFVEEISKGLSKRFQIEVFADKDSDDLSKIVYGNFDVVIPINGRSQSLKASIGRLLGRYKLLITGHSGVGRDDIWNIAIAKPDVFVALTDYMASWAKKWAWGTKIVKIPNGIDLDKFSPVGSKLEIDLPRPVILSVGALEWYKHHEKVIQVVSMFKLGSVLIVGEGQDKEKLANLGTKLLGKRFKIMSFDYKEMPSVYRSADLFTLPSWDREAFGLVYLEALASGLGVVAPDDLSRKEIVGEAGLLVNTQNLEEYKKALDQALKINWQKKARKQAEKFSWNKIVEKYEELFKNLR